MFGNRVLHFKGSAHQTHLAPQEDVMLKMTTTKGSIRCSLSKKVAISLFATVLNQVLPSTRYSVSGLRVKRTFLYA